MHQFSQIQHRADRKSYMETTANPSTSSNLSVREFFVVVFITNTNYCNHTRNSSVPRWGLLDSGSQSKILVEPFSNVHTCNQRNSWKITKESSKFLTCMLDIVAWKKTSNDCLKADQFSNGSFSIIWGGHCCPDKLQSTTVVPYQTQLNHRIT